MNKSVALVEHELNLKEILLLVTSKSVVIRTINQISATAEPARPYSPQISKMLDADSALQ